MANYSHNANCITPIMTDNKAPSPWVVTPSNEVGGYECFKAFNQTYSSDVLWAFEGSSGSVIITCDKSYTVSSYTITSSYPSYPGGAPYDWTLQYSTNGSSWSTGDTRNVQNNWAQGEMRTYNLSSPVSGSFFKLNITANNGHVYTHIYELELIGSIAWTHFSKISGVAKDSVSKVKGITKTSIAKVNGITV